MMKKISTLALIVCMISCLIAIPQITVNAATSGTCGEELAWSFEDGTLTISGNGNMTTYAENSVVPWYSLTEEISSVIIGNDVTSISPYAFYNCTAIEKIYWNAKNTADFSSTNNVFYRAGQNRSGIEVIFTDEVETIPACVFYPTPSSTYAPKIKKVSIGKNVKSIGDSAFHGCGEITDVTITGNPTSIGNSAFYKCTSLANISIPNGITAIENSLFNGCTGLTNITIPSGVTNIGRSAFRECVNLSSVTIPNTVTSIDDSAFYNCSNLTQLTIPDSVTNLSEAVFEGCTSLKSITLPDGITNIKKNLFCNCGSLASVKFSDNVTNIGASAFSGCTSLINISIPNGVTYIGSAAFSGCTSLTSIIIPNGVTTIETSVFKNCKSLTSITVPSGITSIGSEAFSRCSTVENITIPDGVKSIGSSAFFNCNALTSITIPSAVTSIGTDAFNNCTAVEKIYWNAKSVSDFVSDNKIFYKVGQNGGGIEAIFGDEVKKIPAYAFYPSSSSSTSPKITKLIIGENLTNIRKYAFRNCDTLTDIYYAGTEEEWNNITIGTANAPIKNAVKHYGYHPSSSNPTISISSITADTVSVNTENCNNITSGKIILAVYNPNGALTYAETKNLADSVAFANLELTNGTAKVMLWNGVGTITPLAKPATETFYFAP